MKYTTLEEDLIEELIDDIFLTSNTKFICCFECGDFIDATTDDETNLNNTIEHYHEKHQNLLPRKLNLIDFIKKINRNKDQKNNLS